MNHPIPPDDNNWQLNMTLPTISVVIIPILIFIKHRLFQRKFKLNSSIPVWKSIPNPLGYSEAILIVNSLPFLEMEFKIVWKISKVDIEKTFLVHHHCHRPRLGSIPMMMTTTIEIPQPPPPHPPTSCRPLSPLPDEGRRDCGKWPGNLIIGSPTTDGCHGNSPPISLAISFPSARLDFPTDSVVAMTSIMVQMTITVVMTIKITSSKLPISEHTINESTTEGVEENGTRQYLLHCHHCKMLELDCAYRRRSIGTLWG